MENFKKWLKKQDYKISVIAYLDEKFPELTDWRQYKNYLLELGADEEYISEFEEAWEKYWELKWGEQHEQDRICKYDPPRTKSA